MGLYAAVNCVKAALNVFTTVNNIELKWKMMETGQLNPNTEPLGVFSSLDFISDVSAVKCAPMFVYVASVFVF